MSEVPLYLAYAGGGGYMVRRELWDVGENAGRGEGRWRLVGAEYGYAAHPACAESCYKSHVINDRLVTPGRTEVSTSVGRTKTTQNAPEIDDAASKPTTFGDV